MSALAAASHTTARTSPVSEEHIEIKQMTIPIYQNTRWEILSDHIFKLTSPSKGKFLICRLDMATIEKANECAEFLIRQSPAKPHRQWFDMAIHCQEEYAGKFKGSITYKFHSPSSLRTFMTYCQITKIWENTGLTVRDQTGSSAPEITGNTVTYVHNTSESMQRLFEKISAFTQKVSQTYSDENYDSRANLDHKPEVFVKYPVEKSCVLELKLYDSASPFPIQPASPPPQH